MRQFTLSEMVLVVGSIVLFADGLQAQPRPAVPASRPSYSPYMNLLWGGGRGASPALNYLGIVRPQMQMQEQAAQMQAQLYQTNQALQQTNQVLATGADALLPATGRGATFGNYSHYYPTLGGGGGSALGGARTGMMNPMMGGMNIGQAPNRPAAGGGGRAGGMGMPGMPGMGGMPGMRR